MINDPALQQIVDRGPSQFMTRRQKFDRYLLWFLTVVVVGSLVGLVVVRGVANRASDASKKATQAQAQNAVQQAQILRQQAQIQAQIQAACGFWRDLAELPLSPTTTKTGFTIVADSRNAYAGLGCVLTAGALPAPDPRVVPYLK